jgi:hypothetical protein
LPTGEGKPALGVERKQASSGEPMAKIADLGDVTALGPQAWTGLWSFSQLASEGVIALCGRNLNP